MAEDTPSRELLENLVERLDYLERILQAQTARLYAVERRLGLEPSPSPRPHGVEEARREEPPRPAQRRPAPEDDGADAPRPGGAAGPRRGDADAPEAWARPFEPRAAGPQPPPGVRQTPPPRRQTPPPSAPARQTRDIESLIGGSWFAWGGILPVIVAGSVFLQLAFENEWIGPGARVALGALGGLALLVVGERLRSRGLRAYAFVLSGGGILILYLSIYASYNFYPLLDQPVAFLLMALVTTAAVLLSVRLNALAIAILGLVGGFLTPVLISSGRDNEVALFTYVALLDAGVLA